MGMVKKVSKEEKQQKIVDWFMSSSEVFVLKELEKKIPKHCGISSMLLKDLLTELIGDNKINCEKIGTSNLYWRFMYQDRHKIQCNVEKLQEETSGIEQQNEEFSKTLEKMRNKRKETDERKQLISEYTDLLNRKAALEKTKELATTFSKAEFSRLKDDVQKTKSSINELTDDIYTIQGYVCSKLP